MYSFNLNYLNYKFNYNMFSYLALNTTRLAGEKLDLDNMLAEKVKEKQNLMEILMNQVNQLNIEYIFEMYYHNKVTLALSIFENS